MFLIQYKLEIEDDYGFNNLQLAYEIQRPDYLGVEPYIAMFRIPELNRDTTKQNINYKTSLKNLIRLFTIPVFREELQGGLLVAFKGINRKWMRLIGLLNVFLKFN